MQAQTRTHSTQQQPHTHTWNGLTPHTPSLHIHCPFNKTKTNRSVFRSLYGTVHAHILLPIQTAASNAAGYVVGQLRRGRDGVVGGVKASLGFVRDGFEVVGIVFGMLVLGRKGGSSKEE